MMLCKCGGESHVIETRESSGGLRRRRGCHGCGRRFTTAEVEVQGRRPAMVLTDTQVAALRQFVEQARLLAEAIGPLLPPLAVPVDLQDAILTAEAAA